ncbi:hypothetical protein ZWY2020_044803 [Hordeum vulgare]|nr:hypothetical protein ZWY2020_044803 [Hordeum vulgare]
MEAPPASSLPPPVAPPPAPASATPAPAQQQTVSSQASVVAATHVGAKRRRAGQHVVHPQPAPVAASVVPPATSLAPPASSLAPPKPPATKGRKKKSSLGPKGASGPMWKLRDQETTSKMSAMLRMDDSDEEERNECKPEGTKKDKLRKKMEGEASSIREKTEHMMKSREALTMKTLETKLLINEKKKEVKLAQVEERREEAKRKADLEERMIKISIVEERNGKKDGKNVGSTTRKFKDWHPRKRFGPHPCSPIHRKRSSRFLLSRARAPTPPPAARRPPPVSVASLFPEPLRRDPSPHQLFFPDSRVEVLSKPRAQR